MNESFLYLHRCAIILMMIIINSIKNLRFYNINKPNFYYKTIDCHLFHF